jgi:lysozyme family protein
MAASTFDEALRRLLAHEGGYSNHPSDPGGPTNFGITLQDYRRYVKPGATAADVRAMKIEQAKAIYRAKYWSTMRCDELPAGVDYCVFDYGVNSGTGRAPKVLQRVVGIQDDGVIGPVTLAAVRARDPKSVVAAICDERLAFLKRLKTWPVFGKGWSRRVAEVRSVSLRIATERAPSPSVVPTEAPVPGKGAVPAPSVAKRVIVGTGVGAPVAAGSGFWPWLSQHPWEAAAIGATVVIVVGGSIYLFNKLHRRRQEAPVLGIQVVPEMSRAGA